MRTSRPDRNYLSMGADPPVWFAGTSEQCPATLPDPFVVTPLKALEWDSILKVSLGSGIHIHGAVISQGRENVIDCNNRTHYCSFQGEFGVNRATGDQIITVKGGCHDLLFSGALFSRGRKGDVVVGAWSDQCHEPSFNLDFTGLYRADSKPVTFVLGRVKSPLRALLGRPRDILLPQGAKVLFWRSLGEQIYWWAKLAAVKAGLFK